MLMQNEARGSWKVQVTSLIKNACVEVNERAV